MSRLRRAFHNAASSYLALGAGTAFSLASVPLALHYLSKERFALWALMVSIGGFLNLIDLGMSSSFAFHLIDRKDKPADEVYGSLILTGWLVTITQACLLFLACFALAPGLAALVHIPAGLRPEFIRLMRWQGIGLSIIFASRIFSHLLYVHQRNDLANYAQIAGVGLNLFLLWRFFHAGHGVFSLTWALGFSAVANAVAAWLACWRLRLFPAPGRWGRPSWHLFRELFTFGTDLFLIGLGTQLILFSQTMIITRWLGLEAAALWSVGTKAYSLLIQLIWRTTDAPLPGFAEMLARGESDRLKQRYQTLVMTSSSMAAFCAVAFALCNSPFVAAWTTGKFSWPVENDLLLGCCLVVSTLARSHNWLIAATKQVRAMPYVFCAEGLALIAVAFALMRWAGLQGLIIASLACNLSFTGAYGLTRVARFFEVSRAEVGWRWLAPARKFFWRFGLLALGVWLATSSLGPASRFLIHAAVCATAGVYLLARFGLPSAFQAELLHRLPAWAARILSWLFHPSAATQARAAVAEVPKP